ncbi:DUF2793 domain-containing protein [Brevundimonas sp. Root1279]|uniref:DUF2793 domain-containing protein n=1 Tax=Brevundimonas sp. Root1279 TaxID=1736443 RepID=UPI0009EC8BA4|nr:DUF2793 domain-containing protein [Brevundimonas sp. Root1279]
MSEQQSARLGLPYLAAGQLQKHITVNEALTRLDAFVQARVESRTVYVQPESPPDGVMHLIPSGASGDAWADFPAGSLARAEFGAWSVIEPPPGMVVFVADSAELLVRSSEGWASVGDCLHSLQGIDSFGLGLTGAAQPFAACLNSALWTARSVSADGSGDLQIILNKEAASNRLGVLFQAANAGRAELALVGDNTLQLKVSDDGVTWRSAWSVDCATGGMAFDRGAHRRVVTTMAASGSYSPPAWARTIEVVAVGGGGGGGAGFYGASGSRFGGGGGGAGGVARAVWNASELTAGLSIAVGTAGSGGAGNPGGAGGGSAVYSAGIAILISPGGGGGGLGSATGGAAGAGGAGVPNSNGGGASSVTAGGAAGKGFDRPDAPGGGGAGGGLDASSVARNGGAGGDGGALAVKATGGASGVGANGGSGSAAPQPNLHWAGGGGGGGAANAAGSGFDGASGGGAGGGGGGGGAGLTGGGAGGPGAPGVVWIIAAG